MTVDESELEQEQQERLHTESFLKAHDMKCDETEVLGYKMIKIRVPGGWLYVHTEKGHQTFVSSRR